MKAPQVGGSRPDAVDTIITQWGQVHPDLDVTALAVFGRLHRTFLLYRERIGVVFARLGTTESGFNVLAALRRAEPEPVSAGELARQTLVTTGGMSLRLRRLEAEGWVRRVRVFDDQRMVYVSLTAAGRDLVDQTAGQHFKTLTAILEDLSHRERTDLASLLSRLYDVLNSDGDVTPREKQGGSPPLNHKARRTA